MKVNRTEAHNIQNTETNAAKRAGKSGATGVGRTVEKNAPAASSQESVKAEFSAKGKEMVRAKAIATQTPDVREDKIAELKKRIAEGSYQVDADAVADRLVDEHLHTNIG